MIINCGFNRKTKHGIEHKNVTNIQIDNLDWETEGAEIRDELMRHRPEGDGWVITGYALISKIE